MDSDRNDFAILLDHDLNKKTYENSCRERIEPQKKHYQRT